LARSLGSVLAFPTYRLQSDSHNPYYGLMKDIKGYYIRSLSPFNSSIEKSYDGFTVNPWWATPCTYPE